MWSMRQGNKSAHREAPLPIFAGRSCQGPPGAMCLTTRRGDLPWLAEDAGVVHVGGGARRLVPADGLVERDLCLPKLQPDGRRIGGEEIG